MEDEHVDAEAWDAFVSKLDRPVRANPRLVELFSRPQRLAQGVYDEEDYVQLAQEAATSAGRDRA